MFAINIEQVRSHRYCNQLECGWDLDKGMRTAPRPLRHSVMSVNPSLSGYFLELLAVDEDAVTMPAIGPSYADIVLDKNDTCRATRQ